MLLLLEKLLEEGIGKYLVRLQAILGIWGKAGVLVVFKHPHSKFWVEGHTLSALSHRPSLLNPKQSCLYKVQQPCREPPSRRNLEAHQNYLQTILNFHLQVHSPQTLCSSLRIRRKPFISRPFSISSWEFIMTQSSQIHYSSFVFSCQRPKTIC